MEEEEVVEEAVEEGVEQRAVMDSTNLALR